MVIVVVIDTDVDNGGNDNNGGYSMVES